MTSEPIFSASLDLLFHARDLVLHGMSHGYPFKFRRGTKSCLYTGRASCLVGITVKGQNSNLAFQQGPPQCQYLRVIFYHEISVLRKKFFKVLPGEWLKARLPYSGRQPREGLAIQLQTFTETPVLSTVRPYSPHPPSAALLTASLHPRLALSCSGATLAFWEPGILCWGGAEWGSVALTHTFIPSSSHLLAHCREHSAAPFWSGPGDTTACFPYSRGHSTLFAWLLSPTCFVSF